MDETLTPTSQRHHGFAMHCVFAVACWLVSSQLINWVLAGMTSIGSLDQESFDAILQSNARLGIDCVLILGAFFGGRTIWQILRQPNSLPIVIIWSFVSLFGVISMFVFC